MSLVNKVRNYILEEEFKINILKNRINIANYDSIGHFDSNKVIIYYEDGMITVTGNDLVVSKLMEDEVLISGTIKNIELR